MIRFFFGFLCVAFLISCNNDNKLGKADLPDDYFEQLEEFYSRRHQSLTHETGWMRIAGMYWLNQGTNTFGSGSSNDVVFPAGFIPEYAGIFEVTGDTVRLINSANLNLTHNDERITSLVMYPAEQETRARYETLEWFIIKRLDLIGIRLFNSYNERADAFTGFPRYPVLPDNYVSAEFIKFDEPEIIRIANILGQEDDFESPGRLRFRYAGKIHEIITLPGGEGSAFVILGDLTNRDETYQAGRYLYVDYPTGDNSYTTIDLNRLYNPPCAYNAFTTCQLPPVQNRLDVRVEAGEKRPDDYFSVDPSN